MTKDKAPSKKEDVNPAIDPEASAEDRLKALAKQQKASQKQATGDAQAEADAQTETRNAFLEGLKKRNK